MILEELNGKGFLLVLELLLLAGGLTTVIDMPFNREPSTDSVETLLRKVRMSFVEPVTLLLDLDHLDDTTVIGFRAGLVLENALSSTALERFLQAGALGLKSFMCPSGINTCFPLMRFLMEILVYSALLLSEMLKKKRKTLGSFEGGISSLQYVLPATWTAGRKYLELMASWWSKKPAELAGLHLKVYSTCICIRKCQTTCQSCTT